MPRYAHNTKVPVDNSIAEIKRTIRRYGADAIAIAEGAEVVQVMFRHEKRHVKFVVSIKEADARETRRLWRCLVLVIKSKLESVATGVVSFEDEFLAHIVMPDGKTVGEHVRENLAIAYETGRHPPLLEDLR